MPLDNGVILSSVSVGALSVEIPKGVNKAVDVINDFQSFLDESGALQIRLKASLTRYSSLKIILFGRECPSDSIPPECFFSDLSREAQADILQVMQRLEALLSTETTTIREKCDVEHHPGSPDKSANVGLLPDCSRWAWSVGSGKSQCMKLVNDVQLWLDIIADVIRVYMMDVQVGEERLKKLAKASQEAQDSGFVEDCALAEITTNKLSSSMPLEGLLLRKADIKRRGPSSHLTVGQYQDQNVLLENTINFTGTEPSEASFALNRAHQLGLLLRQQKDTEFLQFPFLGFVREGDEGEKISFVYTIPPYLQNGSTSLLNAFKISQGNHETKPSLTSRVKLAYRLANSLFRQHAVGWLHKGIRSSRVLLFTPKDHQLDRIDHAFLFGLEYARAETTESLLRGDNDFDDNLYRHPERWGVPTETFSRAHDIYALGVVLAEIGCWRSVKEYLSQPARVH